MTTEKLSPELADAVAAMMAAADQRGWTRGFQAGHESGLVAGNNAAVAIDQPVFEALRKEIQRLRALVPPDHLELLEAGKGTPDA